MSGTMHPQAHCIPHQRPNKTGDDAMKRVLATTCAFVTLTGFAVAQSSTGTNQPSAQSTAPAAGSSGSSGQAENPGVRRVDGSLARITISSYYKVNPADMRASKIMGKSVYNLNNENIGEVNDLIIDNGKTIKAIVVGVGGFLGMGERNVALEPGAVVLSEMATARHALSSTRQRTI
jgi:sporulation protein YlmC with PRC-barrel domain